MKNLIIIFIVLSAIILSSCEKEYSIKGNHNTDPNYPANSNAIEKIIEISDYIITSESINTFDFAFDSNNTLWVVTNFGLLKITENDHELFYVPYSATYDTNLSTITIDNNDNIWLTSLRNVYKFSSINDEWTTYSYDDGVFFKTGYSRVFCDFEGRIYVTDGHSVYEFQNNTWSELLGFDEIIDVTFPYLGDPGSNDVIARDNDFLWISTDIGLIKYKNDTCYEFLTKENSELMDNNIYSVHTDSKNRIWINYGYDVQVIEDSIWSTYESKYHLKVCGEYIIADEYSGTKILFYINNSWVELLNDYFFNIKYYKQTRIDADNKLWLSGYDKIYKINPEVFQR